MFPRRVEVAPPRLAQAPEHRSPFSRRLPPLAASIARVGPHKEAHGGNPYYEAREDHLSGYQKTRATFSITNHGGGPPWSW
jgi:hypothetical protein